MMYNGLRMLRSRGLVKAVTNEQFDTLHAAAASAAGSKPWSVYLGIDPTADGLHVGHLLGVLALRNLQQCGLRPIALVGGATGLIGDPTDRTSERPLLSHDLVRSNATAIQLELESLLDFDEGTFSAKMVNNLDWFGKMSTIDFIRDVGRNFRVGTMLSRESTKARLESANGLSFTEFSYQVLQGYDFLHLHSTENCFAQVGGSDQWGNIVSGIELVRRSHGNEVFGITTPLLTSSGQKFGKSAGNAVWLNKDKTSDFAFYQYFLQRPDDELHNLLLLLTNLDVNEIDSIVNEHLQQPHLRMAQKLLATQVLGLIRGDSSVARAIRISEVLFNPQSSEVVSRGDVEDLVRSNQVSSTTISWESGKSMTLADCIVTGASICKSKGELRRLVKNNGIAINGMKVTSLDDLSTELRNSNFLNDEMYMLVRIGKKSFSVVLFAR